MPIYLAAPVTEDPEIYLECWSIRRTNTGALHFVGFNVASRDGRVSTPIVEFDAQRRTGITESGRRYYLLGPGGYDSDAEYVWNWLVSRRQIKSSMNVTPELVPDWRSPAPAIQEESVKDSTSALQGDDSSEGEIPRGRPDDD